MSRYCDMPVCDLRNLNDLEVIRQIELIQDVAVLILPKDASNEAKVAFENIPKEDIASIVYLNSSDQVNVLNGFNVLTENDFSGDRETIYVVNGFVIIESIRKEAKGSVIINGMTIINESIKDQCNITFPMLNGVKLYIDFDAYKFYMNEVDIDSELLSYFKPKTLILCGNAVHIAKEVTVEQLKESGIQFCVGNEITCYQNIAAYIKATATVGNCVRVLGE